jgi:signal transduction histidine kinase
MDRMKTMFITNLSHELRTPVTTIQSYAYLLQRTPLESAKWREYLDALVQETNAQAQLGEDILQISRIYTRRVGIKPYPTSLNELTEAAIADHQTLAQEQKVTLDYDPIELEPMVLVDSQQIMQVLNILVKDAIRYTPEGGQVMVSTGKREAEGRVWATVSVSDTGEGMSAEDQPYVFERFFREGEPQSQRVTETGLRLMIVKGIVELHEGQVTVESPSEFVPSKAEGLKAGEGGAGSTFTVWLPLVD